MKDELKKLQAMILDGDLTEAVRLCDEVMAMAEKSPWQPIETAPKDGTRILAWNSEYGARETKSETYREGSIGFSEGRTDRWWEWLEPQNNWSLKWSPTHWMPLPPHTRPWTDHAEQRSGAEEIRAAASVAMVAAAQKEIK